MEYSTLNPRQEISVAGIVYDRGSLFALFQNLSDPRHAHGRRYSLTTLLVIIFLAKLSGKDRPMEIADWGHNHALELADLLGLSRTWMPHHNTIRRVFQSTLDESEFDRLVRTYSQTETAAEGEQLAIDGKALRGTRMIGQAGSEYVLGVYNVDTQQVVAQVAIDSKENEISAAARALEGLAIAGKVFTGDALHTQRAISEQIVGLGGDYLWPVKENQPRLYEDITRLFAPDQPKPGFGKIETDFLTASKTNYGHGRIEKRTILTSAMLGDYLDWPGQAQVYCLIRKFSWLRQGKIYKTSCETEYGITSLTREQASPSKVLQIRRKHWRIETTLHYSRDVTFREDSTRMTIRPAGRILASVNNLVLGLIRRAGYSNAAQARRYFEGHLPDAFALLTSGKLPT